MSGVEFSSLLSACESHRLVGLLGAAVEGGGLPVTPSQRDDVEHLVQSWMSAAVRIEAVAVRVVGVLDACGIEHRVLKGVALANTVYRTPELRVFGDIDLLIRGIQFGAAAAVLTKQLGGWRVLPEIRPGFDARFGREILVRVANREVDLHRTFVDGPYGFSVVIDEAWAQPQTFRLGGRTMRTLPVEHQLIHAAMAAVLGDWPPRLIAQRDALELLLCGRVNGDATIGAATRWKVQAVLAKAIRVAVETLPVAPAHPLVDWAGATTPSRLDRLLLASYRGAARGYTSHLAALIRIPGLGEKAAYARAIALPEKGYREARGLTRTGLLGRGVSRLRGR